MYSLQKCEIGDAIDDPLLYIVSSIVLFPNIFPLRQLDLGVNNISNNGASLLARGLKSNHSLLELHLYVNSIEAQGATSLASALVDNTTLRILSLSKNPLGDAGVSAIADSLAQNSTITVLKLGSTQMSDIGAAAIGVALLQRDSQMLSFTQYWMHQNRIGDVGADAIAKALSQCSSVQSLAIDGNCFGNAGLATFTDAVSSNECLSNLDLSQTNADDQELKQKLRILWASCQGRTQNSTFTC